MTSNGEFLLNEILPEFDVSATYSIRIRASADQIYSVLQQGIPSGMLTKVLMALRQIPRVFRPPDRTRRSEDAFYKLKQSQNREIVIGIIGQFWKPAAKIITIHSLDEFLQFKKNGYCKAALNLRIQERNERECILSTETRVRSFGSAKKPFQQYWRVIGPFSGLIRKEILRKIKLKAEK